MAFLTVSLSDAAAARDGQQRTRPRGKRQQRWKQPRTRRARTEQKWWTGARGLVPSESGRKVGPIVNGIN